MPNFRHNLLFVQKSVKDVKCQFSFFHTHCLILDSLTGVLKGVGEARNGLYYLINHLTKPLPAEWLTSLQSQHAFNSATTKDSALAIDLSNSTEVWHHRLGHALVSNIKRIPFLSKLSYSDKVCITCPMAKFTKLPYMISDSHAVCAFDLIHIDI